jgi:hypothetical protein
MFAVLTSVFLYSFSPNPGGYSYEVYLNNQLVIKEHMYGRKETPTIPLNMTTAQDAISVAFNNCNKVDVSRKISLKDDHDTTIKEWTFGDSPDIKNQMKIKVSEIAAVRNKHSTVKLVYSSQAISDGVHLINLQLSDATALKK